MSVDAHDVNLLLGITGQAPPPEDDVVPGLDQYRVEKATDLVSASAMDDKFLVFSHHADILKCLQRKLKRTGIKALYFSCMNAGEDMLTTFREDPEAKAILINIRLTNAGLNLTAANKLIFMEAPLNSSRYKQAVGRAARTGQTRDVHVTILQDPTLQY